MKTTSLKRVGTAALLAATLFLSSCVLPAPPPLLLPAPPPPLPVPPSLPPLIGFYNPGYYHYGSPYRCYDPYW